jgi:ribonuclease Z
MKKSPLIIIAVVAIALFAYSQRATVLSALADRVLQARMGADAIVEMEDGLHLALCGAGSPMGAPDYSGPCVAVVAGERLFIVDAGTNGRRNLNRMNYGPGGIEAVFLTHFHSDHIDGLGEMSVSRWAGGDFPGPLPVYGPEGVERVVNGLNEAYALDVIYRHAHHGDLVAPVASAGMQALRFATPAEGELVTVYNDGGLIVEALLVDHSPIKPAVAYRFSYKGRSILISGDTVKSANLQTFAEGVDILVHEALGMKITAMMQAVSERNGNTTGAKIMHDIQDYHTSPVEAAEIARDAHVGHLLYYHIVPPLMIPGQKALFLDGAEDIFPDYTIGVDGVAFSLPANSDEIIQTRKGL